MVRLLWIPDTTTQCPIQRKRSLYIVSETDMRGALLMLVCEIIAVSAFICRLIEVYIALITSQF